jgi:hypothetical protein
MKLFVMRVNCFRRSLCRSAQAYRLPSVRPRYKTIGCTPITWKSLLRPFHYAEATVFSAREAIKGNEQGIWTCGPIAATLVSRSFSPAFCTPALEFSDGWRHYPRRDRDHRLLVLGPPTW